MKTVDVGQLLDDGSWSGYQKLLIFGTAMTIILDGIDNQLLGNAIPLMMNDWSVTRGAFSNVLFVGPIGMMFGGLFGGMLGDRIGRRSALLFSVIAFALLTLAIAFSNGIPMLGVLRFLSGLGLGGAMPNAAALSSEYVPKRKRAFAVTLTIICIPLGGFVAAYLSKKVLPSFGWHALFQLGGIIPIVLAIILFKVLPESPRYLAGHRDRWPELIQLLRKLGHDVPDDVSFAEAVPVEKGVKGISKATAAGDVLAPMQTRGVGGNTGAKSASIGDLFKAGLGRDTIGLFGSFFFCLLANYIGIQLLVVMLTGAGFTQPDASGELQNWNLGGVGGALLGAYLIQQMGSRITMLGMSAISIGCAILLTTMAMDPKSVPLTIMLVLLGGLMNAVQTTMYALAANVYPTAIRGTGIGTAVAIGRIGNAMAGYVGNYALDHGGPPSYFWSFAITMTLALLSLAIVRRHIERQ